MTSELEAAEWAPAAGNTALAEGAPSQKKVATKGWRDSFLKLDPTDEGDDSVLKVSTTTDGEPGNVAKGWRSTVLAHSKSEVLPLDDVPFPLQDGNQPSVPANTLATGSGATVDKPNSVDHPSTPDPDDHTGRLTASAFGTSAKQPAVRPQLPPAAAPKPFSADTGQDAALPDAFASPIQGKSFVARRIQFDTEPDGGAGLPITAASVRTGWRTTVGSLTQKDRAEPAPDGDGAAYSTPAAPAPHQSLWRNITKSFASHFHREESDAPRASPSERPAKSSSSFFPSSRSPAVLSANCDDDAARVARIEAAAERAVREADTAADGGSAANDGANADIQSGSNHRLRFNPNTNSMRSTRSRSLNGSGAEVATSTHSNQASSRPHSLKGQSFQDRVANALGLGALTRSRSVDGGPQVGGNEADPTAQMHSALKKEGTSRQLRLDFALKAEGNGNDDISTPKSQGDSTYRSFKFMGQSSVPAKKAPGSVMDVNPFADPAVAVLLSTVTSVPRPDSVEVPGHLHGGGVASGGNLDVMQVQDLEDTLLSPSALLPPGESLSLPMPRAGPVLLMSSHTTEANEVAQSSNNGVGETVKLPPMAEATASSQARLEILRGISMKSRGIITAAEEREKEEEGEAAVAAAQSMAAPSAASKAEALAAEEAAAAAAAAAAGSASTDPSVKLKARSTIKLPIITTGHWDNLVFATVWRVGRVFGFQAFNVRPSTQDDPKREYVPASIFVASDHLIQLLVKNGYVRRHRGDDTDEERFAKALFEFHSTIFYCYEMQWIKMQRLSPRAQRFTDQLRERVFSDHYVINGLLCELALYFLIYTEAANVRFCPEAIWMIFWSMNHSYVMADLWNRGSPDRMPNSRERLPQLRNTFQHLTKELQVQISIRPLDMRPEDCGKMSSILSRLSASSDVPLSDRELLADLICYGDGGFFMDRVITPIFFVMSYEIDHLSTLSVDTTHRLGYDDFNESLTCRDVVYAALLELRVSPQDIAQGASNDSYHSLTSLGFQGRTVIGNKFDPQVAAEWWRHRVFVKTYRERRSWWGIYRAFFRVYAFHFVIFHTMQAQAFAGWNWRIVSSAILMHAWLTWLERVANWMMTWPSPEPLQTTMTKIFDRKGFYKLDEILALLKQQKQQHLRYRGGVAALNNTERLKLMKAHQTQSANDISSPLHQLTIRQLRAMQPERILKIEGTPMYGLFGGLTEWLLLSILLSTMYTLQFVKSPLQMYANNYWGYVSAGYTGMHVLHWLLTTRDGYVISLTEALNLPEYFQNWSARPRPCTWMYSDMHTKWKNFFVNAFFWMLVFALKIPFDYFVIHKPLVKPIRLLLTRNWMGCKGPVYRFGNGVHVPCIGGDWILVAARVFPFIIVALFDTALFYQFIVTAFGIYHGLIKLDLGVVSTWDDLVREFHKSPPRWWIRCMSFTGNENQKNLLFHTISANAQAAADADKTGVVPGEEGGAGAGVKKNVAISDGLMFKIKIVTPEEIKSKQALMLKERKINMQAGKGASSNEVEGKAVKAVQDKVSAPSGPGAGPGAGTAGAGARGTLASVPSVKSTAGGGGAPALSSSTAPGASASGTTAGATGGGSKAPNFKNIASVVNAVTGRNGVTLVGQDYKKAPTRPQGVGAFFGRRDLNDSEVMGMSTPGLVQLPGMVQMPGARLDAKAGPEAGAAPGAGKMKSLGSAAVASAILSRKAGNQVKPAPVAEAREELNTPERGCPSSSSAESPWAASRPASVRSVTRSHASLHQRQDDPAPFPRWHPAWQPETLLGSSHKDYDPSIDPMAKGNTKMEDEGPGLRNSRAWRFWSWRRGQPKEEEDVGLVPGPALASLRIHGWRPERETEPLENDEDGEEEKDEGNEEEARVYHGAVAEAVTLVGPDGRPLHSEGEEGGAKGAPVPRRRAAPVVLLSEVPMIRVESESDNDSYMESPREGPMDRPVVHTGASSGRRSIEFRETEAFRQGGPESGSGGVRVGQGPAADLGPAAGTAVRGDDAYSNQEDDDGRVLAGRPSVVVKLPKRSVSISVSKDLEGTGSWKGASASAKGPKSSPSSQTKRRGGGGGGFFASLFRFKSGGAAAKREADSGRDHDSDDDDENGNHGNNSSDDDDEQDWIRTKDPSRTDRSHSIRRADSSVHAKRSDVSIRGGIAWHEPSVRSGGSGWRGGSTESSTRGGKRFGDVSMRVGRAASSVGPAAAGFGTQRQRSITGPMLNRRASFASPANLQRVRSISAAATTNFEQQQFAKKYERQHSVAAQVVKRDLATRTTSMVLMGTEDLQNMDDDDLDVVSEQMMMWSSFAEAWDAILDDLREGDLISDKEMSLLKFVRLESSGKLYGLRPILLPTFFFAGQIRKVVDTGRVNTAQVMVLTEFRVLMTWLACQLGIMSGKHAHVIMTASLYGGIINVKHINLRKKSFDSAIKLIGLVETAIKTKEVPFEIQTFAEHLLIILSGLESECYAVQKMWELGRVNDDDLDEALTLFEVVQDMQHRVRTDPEKLKQCLKRAGGGEDLTTNSNVLLQVTTVLHQMLTTTAADATPQGEEAQRVLGFFINSLGHPSLDKPQSIEFMLSWSVMTPVYEEDVLYAVDSKLTAEELGLKHKKMTDLLSETDDGFSLMAYLRAMFAFEWANFKERMRRLSDKKVDVPDWSQVTELDFGPGGVMFDYRTELQLWASYRGQLLARTVRGMMCYERALKVICRMEYPTPMGITDQDYERWVDAMVGSKFEYVIAVQTYGRNAKSKDLQLRQLAQSVDTLVQRFPTLKVAYLDDAVEKERYGPTQYSVLVRNRKPSDPITDPTRPFSKIAEAYRVRLPFNRYSHRGVVLGEGKPENQNHAIIFAFNEGLQAIDMNQDNYLAEALKMRNLLSELNPSNKGAQFLLFADDSPTQSLSPHMTAAELRFVILSRMKRSFPTAIVGFREWIFSANTGALGQYAAATEYSFATIQSRIMTKPGRVRMHYGHPDVFNKTHVMTRGGMSKGTRTLHISEDYFIGAAHTLRGARIRYKEYVSCGKGRDMGFDSILGYQKKISGGAGDLATSREIHRLGTRLEFFRLMSFYHGGIGHFLNSYLTLKAAWYNMWALLLTAMAQAMEMGLKGADGEVTLTQTYNVQQVLQLGTLSIIPYVGQLILETGMLRTLITVFGQIITGSLFFYIFQQQTVAASFSAVMSFGGMRYIGTGRGFSIQTTDFVKMYTIYSRTHLYLGFEIMFMCFTVYALNDCVSCNYALLTWNSWLLAFVMVLCPMWFNPFIFNMSKVQRDYMAWKRWLNGDVDSGTGTNWFTWNRDQLSKARNDDGNVTDPWRNAAREILGTCLPYVLLVLALVSRIQLRIDGGVLLQSPYIEFLASTALLWIVVLLMSYLGNYLLERARSKEWRIIRYVITLTSAVLFIVYMVVLTRFYSGDGLTHIMQVLYANFLILITVHRAATFLFTQDNTVREFVDAGFYLIDVLVGYAMFGMLALLSFVGVVGLLQSKLLFNEAFSQSVQSARVKMQVNTGKQIKRKPKPGLLMTMDEWVKSRPASAASAAPSLAPTVHAGGGAFSRAVSLAHKAPSAAPSKAPSRAPSGTPSIAPSSVVHSGVTSRQGSFSGTVPEPGGPGVNGYEGNDHNGITTNNTEVDRPPLSQLSRRGAFGGDSSVGTGPGIAWAAGTSEESPSNGTDVGLRGRRLRFG